MGTYLESLDKAMKGGDTGLLAGIVRPYNLQAATLCFNTVLSMGVQEFGRQRGPITASTKRTAYHKVHHPAAPSASSVPFESAASHRPPSSIHPRVTPLQPGVTRCNKEP